MRMIKEYLKNLKIEAEKKGFDVKEIEKFEEVLLAEDYDSPKQRWIFAQMCDYLKGLGWMMLEEQSINDQYTLLLKYIIEGKDRAGCSLCNFI